MSQEPSNSSKKRPSSSSYTKSYKDGEVPKAHSAAHEHHFTGHGLFMKESEGRSRVHKDCASLCTDLLRSIHPEPNHTPFPLSKFLSVWQQAQNRNEARVYRDLTPLLVPSPELLSICGHDELKHLAEEISVEWTKGKTLGGPKPKPDFAVGIAPSAFSEEEMAKLQNHRSFERPAAFTDNMYFPFLLCEAKCGNEGINQADRQNMHSSSLAVDAILQLYRAVDESKAIELSGQILVFSVSHDNERVKLYGHFAVVEGEKACFYRYPIASFVLNFEENQGRKRTHDFVREVYDKFYPAHLKRICDALAAMKDPRALSMTSHMSVEDEEEEEAADSQEQDPSARSSEENAGFRVPGTPASKRQKGEVARLQQQLDQQREREAALQKQIGDLLKQQAEQHDLLKQLLNRR